jgi:hypothetical protein
MYKNDRVTRRYSEHFKLKILAELSWQIHQKPIRKALQYCAYNH